MDNINLTLFKNELIFYKEGIYSCVFEALLFEKIFSEYSISDNKSEIYKSSKSKLIETLWDDLSKGIYYPEFIQFENNYVDLLPELDISHLMRFIEKRETLSLNVALSLNQSILNHFLLYYYSIYYSENKDIVELYLNNLRKKIEEKKYELSLLEKIIVIYVDILEDNIDQAIKEFLQIEINWKKKSSLLFEELFKIILEHCNANEMVEIFKIINQFPQNLQNIYFYDFFLQQAYNSSYSRLELDRKNRLFFYELYLDKFNDLPDLNTGLDDEVCLRRNYQSLVIEDYKNQNDLVDIDSYKYLINLIEENYNFFKTTKCFPLEILDGFYNLHYKSLKEEIQIGNDIKSIRELVDNEPSILLEEIIEKMTFALKPQICLEQNLRKQINYPVFLICNQEKSKIIDKRAWRRQCEDDLELEQTDEDYRLQESIKSGEDEIASWDEEGFWKAGRDGSD